MDDPFTGFDEDKPTEPGYYQWRIFVPYAIGQVGYSWFYLFSDMTALCIGTGIREAIDCRTYEIGAWLGPYSHEWFAQSIKAIPLSDNDLHMILAETINIHHD